MSIVQPGNAARERLSAAQRALLEQRLRRAQTQAAPSESIGRRNDAGPAPLSFAQQRLWFLDQFAPGNAAYNMPDVLRLTGPLDHAALTAAINAIVGRHEILRSTFATVAEQPVQIVAPTLTLDLPLHDLSALPEAEREATALRMASNEAQQPFDLATGPLLRAQLLGMAEHDHILLLTMHHIVFDGWSRGIFFRELAAFYPAFASGQPTTLPNLPIQYADFATWQRQWLQDARLDTQRAYWTKQLADAPRRLELPSDRPRPPVQTFRGNIHTFSISADQAEALKALGRGEGCTLFMTLLAAFGTLLARYSGQHDLLIGSPVAGRSHAELEGLIGLFLNTLVFRIDLSGNPDFRTVLRRVRNTALDAFSHQDLPFEQIVEALKLERDLSYNPLFQVMFTLQNTPPAPLELPSLELRPVGIEIHTAKVDLSLSIEEHENGLDALLLYNSDLFLPASIEHLVEHFQRLLVGIVATPQRPLADLPLLSERERDLLLNTWNATATDYPQQLGVHQLFEAQVARTPKAIALVQGRQRLSYYELNQRANQLAHYLRKHGVGPEMLVGLCVERSPEMVIGMLGVLKAGAAYLPLDPHMPAERVARIVAAARPALILTTQDQQQRTDTPTLRLALADWHHFAAEESTNPLPLGHPDNLAYVVYTSGSTGAPKGVMSTHRGVVNYLQFLAQSYALSPNDVVLQLAAFTFDASVRDTLGPLTVGAQVVLVAPDDAKDPDALLAAIVSQRVTCLLSVVPTLLRALLEAREMPQSSFATLRLILMSGEPLHMEDCRRATARFGSQVLLVNQYGPTECTMTSSYYPVRDLQAERGVALVGRPVPNAQFYLLDQRLNPVPIGVPGEVYITGPGLARGYLDRADLTAERFVPNPFGPGAAGMHSRLYKTGDLARYLPDGTIELLGRIDQQLKIRGIRVEPGEIETVLSQHPALQRAVVIAREDQPGDKRLVAYVLLNEATRSNPPASISVELRTFLKAQLPDYMIPAAFVVLETLPLTTTGKVDRKALPPPDQTQDDTGSTYAAPRNEPEARLVQIWAEVLGVAQVGIDDNFFDRGGDSFKGIRVVRAFGPELKIIDLFKYPTIRALAARLAGETVEEGGLLQELTPPVAAHAREFSLVCLPYAGGSAISFQPLAQAMPKNHSLYAVALPGHDFSNPNEQPWPFDTIARTCAEEIKRRISGPLALYGHCAGSALAIEIARLLEAAGVAVETVYVGAAFPNTRMPGRFFDFLARSGWLDRLSGDRTYQTFFTSLGGFSDVIDQQDIKHIIKNIRRDSQDAEDYFTAALAQREAQKLRAPVVCIVGDKDPLTEYAQERYHEWEAFSTTARLVVLPQAGHYFLKHRADDVMAIIAEERQVAQSTPQTRHAGRAVPAASAAAQASASPAAKGLLPNLRIFLLVAFGQFVSLVGSGLTGFALGVWVYLQTGSVTQFALISVCSMLPGIVLSPLAGAIIDRTDRRLVMLLSDLGAGLGTFTLASLLWTGQLEMWQLYAVLIWSAICNTFQRPAYASAIPQLVPKRYLWQANGIVQMAEATGGIIAPALAAALVVSIGLYGVILIDVITFLFAITTLLLVRFPNSLPWRRKEPLMQEMIEGWRYIKARQGLLALLIHAAVSNLFLAISGVLLTPLVLRSLESPTVLGSIMAIGSVGMFIGGLAMSIWGGPRRLMAGLLGFAMLNGLCIALIGWQPSMLLITLGFVGFTLTMALSNGCYTALIQTKVPHQLHGRIFALNQMVALSTTPLGFITAGPLADRVFEPLLILGGPLATSIGLLIGVGPGRGIGLLFIIVGLLTMAITAVGYFYPRIWRLEEEIPDANPEEALIAERDNGRTRWHSSASTA